MATAKKTKNKPSAPAQRAPNAVERTTPAPLAKAAKAKKIEPSGAKQPVKAAPAKVSDKPGIGEGARAPSFTLNDQAGKALSSASLAGAPYVLYFYPKDDTTGCTKQACGFRDSFRAFGKQKARIIGVSPDSEASHARFAQKYGLPFTLLADPEKKLATAYGVWAKKLNYGREYMGIVRSTFVIDAKGVVQKAWRGVKVDGHVAAVLEMLSARS